MSDYIEREAVISRLEKVDMDAYYGFTAAVQFGVDHAIQCIKEAPAADVAPVVRCRECVHNHPEFVKNDAQWCELCRITINPDDFCSRGERIESPTCHDGVCEIPGVEREEDYE